MKLTQICESEQASLRLAKDEKGELYLYWRCEDGSFHKVLDEIARELDIDRNGLYHFVLFYGQEKQTLQEIRSVYGSYEKKGNGSRTLLTKERK
jgi:hypothetical protein